MFKTIGKEPVDLGNVNGVKTEEEVRDKDLRLHQARRIFIKL